MRSLIIHQDPDILFSEASNKSYSFTARDGSPPPPRATSGEPSKLLDATSERAVHSSGNLLT